MWKFVARDMLKDCSALLEILFWVLSLLLRLQIRDCDEMVLFDPS